MKFDVYGRYRVEVVREADRWVLYKLDLGRRVRRPDLVIPSTLASASEIATFLDDLFHEAARPGDRIREIPDVGNITEDDRRELTRLEEAMWREETRFDRAFMERHLATDFFGFGRSGKSYTRAQCLAAAREPIDAVLPLQNLAIRMLDADTAQVTYTSAVTRGGRVEHARRSSIWTRVAGAWVMRFHQGTPYP